MYIQFYRSFIIIIIIIMLLLLLFLTKCWFEPVLWERRADYFMSCD